MIPPKDILRIYLEGIFIPPQNPGACNVVWISTALRWRSPRTPRDRAPMEWAKIHSSGYQTMTSQGHRQWAPDGGQRIQQCPQTNLLNLQVFHLQCHVLRSPSLLEDGFQPKIFWYDELIAETERSRKIQTEQIRWEGGPWSSLTKSGSIIDKRD